MNRNDFYIMITILFFGFFFIYTMHPKPISIIQYPSVNKKELILKDTNGEIINFIKKEIN
jgi:hypothetical protein